jgi:hypothetical protein
VITLARLGHHSGAEFQAKIGKEEEDEGEVFLILLAFLKTLVDLWGFVSGQQR